MIDFLAIFIPLLIINLIFILLRFRIIQNFDTSQLGILSKDIIRIGDFHNSYEAPEYAEKLIRSEHCQDIVSNGRYGGSRSLASHVIYTCPKCNHKHELVFRHGDTIYCKCGLYAYTAGNSLKVW